MRGCIGGVYSGMLRVPESFLKGSSFGSLRVLWGYCWGTKRTQRVQEKGDSRVLEGANPVEWMACWELEEPPRCTRKPFDI